MNSISEKSLKFLSDLGRLRLITNKELFYTSWPTMQVGNNLVSRGNDRLLRKCLFHANRLFESSKACSAHLPILESITNEEEMTANLAVQDFRFYKTNI
jgi:hypothetical protein